MNWIEWFQMSNYRKIWFINSVKCRLKLAFWLDGIESLSTNWFLQLSDCLFEKKHIERRTTETTAQKRIDNCNAE